MARTRTESQHVVVNLEEFAKSAAAKRCYARRLRALLLLAMYGAKKCGQQTGKFLSTPEKSGETAALERWELCHLMQLRSKSLGKWESLWEFKSKKEGA